MPFTAPTAFSAATSGANTFSRKFGANSEGLVVDPYITGYMFIKFAKIPDIVPQLMSSLYSSQMSETQIKNLLAASCTNFTIPGSTMNKTEIIGLGGIRHSYPTNGTYDNTVTMRFFEHSNLPIQKVFHSWFRAIRDYRTGASLMSGGGKTTYTKANYAGACYYWTTRPNGIDVEYYACVTGLFPMKDPADMFGHDIGANDKLDIDMEFSCDYVWHEDWVYRKCQSFADDYHSTAYANTVTAPFSSATVDKYGPQDGVSG